MKTKVIDLAKELGVTSKDLIVALEGMGHKGMRAMSPLLRATVIELSAKMGRPMSQESLPTPPRPTYPTEWTCVEHERLWGRPFSSTWVAASPYRKPDSSVRLCEDCIVRLWREERAKRAVGERGCDAKCRSGRPTAWPFNCNCVCVGWHHPHALGSPAARLFALLAQLGETAPPIEIKA